MVRRYEASKQSWHISETDIEEQVNFQIEVCGIEVDGRRFSSHWRRCKYLTWGVVIKGAPVLALRRTVPSFTTALASEKGFR